MTLIELMIVVFVVALLAAVALPAYQGSVRKARRAEAKAALTTCAQRLERYYTENNSYTNGDHRAGVHGRRAGVVPVAAHAAPGRDPYR